MATKYLSTSTLCRKTTKNPLKKNEQALQILQKQDIPKARMTFQCTLFFLFFLYMMHRGTNLLPIPTSLTFQLWTEGWKNISNKFQSTQLVKCGTENERKTRQQQEKCWKSNIHTQTHIVWVYRSTKKKLGHIFFKSGKAQEVSSMYQSIFFAFLSLSCSKDVEREMTAGLPAPSGEQQRGTKGILSTAYFFLLFFGAEEQPLELPEQSKLRLEVTKKECLFRHFPNYHQEKKISPLSVGTSLRLFKLCPNNVPFKKKKRNQL